MFGTLYNIYPIQNRGINISSTFDFIIISFDYSTKNKDFFYLKQLDPGMGKFQKQKNYGRTFKLSFCQMGR